MKIKMLLVSVSILFLATFFLVPIVMGQCANSTKGDANCDGSINLTDFELWRKESIGILTTKSSDFNTNGTVTLADFEIWRKNYTGTANPGVTLTPTRASQSNPSPTVAVATPTPTVVSSRPTPGASSGIWISREEILKLPMSGSAWNTIKSAADSNWGSADLANNESQHDVLTLAGALVAVRTSNTAMRNKTIAGLNSAMKSPLNRALELGRGLQSYVIAADIIGYKDAAFMDWVQRMVHVKIDGHSCSGEGLLCTAQSSANNWGGHARASVTAAALYLKDQALLTDMANSQKAFIGLSSPNSSKMVYTSTNWHAGSPVAGVNVKGATKNGQDLSGVLPEDWRRASEYRWPPAVTGYMWEGMQGFVVTGVLLHRANILPFSAGDDAIVRAMNILYRIGNPPSGDDTWIPWVVNYYGGTRFATQATNAGKNMGWTDWTHAK